MGSFKRHCLFLVLMGAAVVLSHPATAVGVVVVPITPVPTTTTYTPPTLPPGIPTLGTPPTAPTPPGSSSGTTTTTSSTTPSINLQQVTPQTNTLYNPADTTTTNSGNAGTQTLASLAPAAGGSSVIDEDADTASTLACANDFLNGKHSKSDDCSER